MNLTISVSYTHLDVYKRQDISWSTSSESLKFSNRITKAAGRCWIYVERLIAWKKVKSFELNSTMNIEFPTFWVSTKNFQGKTTNWLTLKRLDITNIYNLIFLVSNKNYFWTLYVLALSLIHISCVPMRTMSHQNHFRPSIIKEIW